MTFPAIQSLNTFQRLMLEWEKFAPYNAGQFATLDVSDAISHEQLARSWQSLTETNGLDRLPLAQAGVMRPDVPITTHVTQELNRRFTGDESPFRPFVIQDSDRIHAGIMYRHAIADSASIRMLMHAWLSGTAPGQFEVDYSEPRVGLVKLARAAVMEVSRLRRLRGVRRLPRKHYLHEHITWSMHELPDGLINRLLEFCRSHGSTINDLFVALAARNGASFVPFAPHVHRIDLAVGTIVDLRSPAQTSFGLSLGFMQTFLTTNQIKDRANALMAANTTSRQARRDRLLADSHFRLRVALWEHGRLNSDDLATFYRKRCPLIAGISNVNLSPTDIGRFCLDQRAIYTRVSPLGPMLPVVFTPTTIGSKLTLGVTTRDGLIEPDRRENLVKAFIDDLIQYAR